MVIGVVGAGYVGLSTAVGLGLKGFKIYLYEKDKEKIKTLKKGKIHIYEPQIARNLPALVNSKIIIIKEEIDSNDFPDVIFLCVGTPSKRNGETDLSQIIEATKQIAKNMPLNKYILIIEKSTVPVGTHKLIENIIREIQPKANFEVVSNPEFLQEGKALENFLNPDRIIIGIKSEKAKEIMQKIYKDFDSPIVFTDVTTAELIKYTANSFLAMKISFINMICDFCEKVGADIEDIALGIGLDKRIGKSFLKAGLGWGGSCFPKDTRAFIKMAEKYNMKLPLIEDTIKINKKRPQKIIEKLKKYIPNLNGKNIAVWGLAFKGGTDDVRDSQSIKVVKLLLKEGAFLNLYDPMAVENFEKELSKFYKKKSRIKYFKNTEKGEGMYSSIENADALLILTDWEEFKKIDIKILQEKMKQKIIIDGRNLIPKEKISEMLKMGFIYESFGRKIKRE